MPSHSSKLKAFMLMSINLHKKILLDFTFQFPTWNCFRSDQVLLEPLKSVWYGAKFPKIQRWRLAAMWSSRTVSVQEEDIVRLCTAPPSQEGLKSLQCAVCVCVCVCVRVCGRRIHRPCCSCPGVWMTRTASLTVSLPRKHCRQAVGRPLSERVRQTLEMHIFPPCRHRPGPMVIALHWSNQPCCMLDALTSRLGNNGSWLQQLLSFAKSQCHF